MSIGPIRVPLGTLLAIVGRAARGPRLVGGVHVEASELTLTAQLASNENLRAWRVSAPLKSLKSKDKSGGVEVPHSMVEELALRMFTDIALQGPVRWQATKEFTEALRSIRVCLKTRQDRRQHLLDAERLLIEALSEDEELSYVYYNLGVVYTELRRLAAEEDGGSGNGTSALLDAQASPAAAEEAFRRQIELTPERWEAYYALALTYWDFEPKRLGDVLNRCDRVVALRPGRANTAKALLVKGHANRKLTQLRAAMKDRRAAMAEAWAALCWSELLGDGSQTAARQLAASALQDLASTYLDRKDERAKELLLAEERGERPPVDVEPIRGWYDKARARWLLGRPVRLAPSDAAIRFDRGRAALTAQGAIRDVDEALRIDPAEPFYWAHLAVRHARLAETTRLTRSRLRHALYARNSCTRALGLLDCLSDDPRELEGFTLVASAYRSLAKACGALGRDFAQQAQEAEDQAAQVEGMREFAAHCSGLLGQWQKERTVLVLGKLAEESSGWKEAQARSAFGRVLLRREDYAWAVQELRRAIELFELQFEEEVPRTRLRMALARALRAQPQPDNRESLRQLRRAVAARPLRSDEREALADAFYEMLDYEHARSSLEDALLWSPNRAGSQRKLGLCHWRLAQDRQDATSRKRLLRLAVRDFYRALELTTSDDLKGQLVAHYWLARLQKELGAYDGAIPYLRRATAFDEAKPLVHVLLGEAYVRARGYLTAEQELEYALANGRGTVDHDDFGRYVDDAGWEAARVRAHAHTLRALGYAERGVLLEDASRDIGDARGHLAKMRQAREHKVSLAACEDVDGLIFLQKGHAPPAIERFETSLGLLAESETYVHLARACLYRLDEKPGDPWVWIRRGEDACRCAIDLDVTERYSREAKSLLTELAAKK